MILDASAILALVNRETGWEIVQTAANGAQVAAMNYAEVISYYSFNRIDPAIIRAVLPTLGIVVVPAHEDLSFDAGCLRRTTADAGLSLGDRYCLALARREGLPAMTADRAWLDVAAAVGVEVRLIR